MLPGGGNPAKDEVQGKVVSEGDRKRLRGKCSGVGVFARRSDGKPYGNYQDRCGLRKNSGGKGNSCMAGFVSHVK